MSKQTFNHLALSLAYLGLMLGSSLSPAQSKVMALNRITAKDRSQAVGSPAHIPPPGSSSYTFTYFDFPQSPNTNPNGINSGAASSKIQIVGAYAGPATGEESGLLLRVGLSKGTITEAYSTVNFHGSSNQSGAGINDFGQIVGTYTDSIGDLHGYEFSGGTFTMIDVPFSGATNTAASQINNSSDIVGEWIDSGNVAHGFLLSGGVYTSFDYPGATGSGGNCLNNKGDIVGFYTDSFSTDHGFLLSGGTYTSIDVPGAVATSAFGINDSGDIVGWYCTTAGCASDLSGLQGFLLKGGVFTTIDAPGASPTLLFDINNKGVIVGSYSDSRGGPTAVAHAFVATP
jgi:uncharacterized membrane protein